MVKSSDGKGDEDLLLRVRAGSTIVEEGRIGSEMYLIAEGEVEIFRRLGHGERKVARLSRGDFFGEMAVLEQGTPYGASARAVSDCRLLPVGSAELDFFLREHPDITLRLLRHLAHRVRTQENETQRVNEVAAGVFAEVPKERLHGMEPVTVRKSEQAAGPAAKLLHEPSETELDLYDGQTVVVGRFDPVTRSSTDIDLGALDPDRALSRRHAKIWCRDGRWYLSEEMAVRNGTYVGRRKVQPGEELEIHDGDVLRFALVELRFRTLSGGQDRDASG